MNVGRSVKHELQTAGRLTGLLFLTVMASWIIGYALIAPILDDPGYLELAAADRGTITIGVLFELVDICAVVGIVAVVFPLLRRWSERLALAYAVLRLLEAVLLLLVAVTSLLQITVSQEYLAASGEEADGFGTLGALLNAFRTEWAHGLLIPVFYSLAAVIFFWFLTQSGLVPRLLCVPGLIVAGLVGLGAVLTFFGIDQLGIFGAPMGLIEIGLGLWLVVKGFGRPPSPGSPSAARPPG
jgi:hypothetical protein